jgi:ATP-dependent HslUV protease ATP-binding subunit HslU
MATEDVDLTFTEDAIEALADAAVEVNGSVENIGARRLQTVLEKVVEEMSFTASDKPGVKLVIDGAYVRDKLGDLTRNADLSRYIL